MSGRAAVPFTPAGTGFNWPSLVGRVSGYIRPVGLRGLGQDSETLNLPFISQPTAVPGTSQVALPGGGAIDLGVTGATSGAPWYANILGSAITSGLKVGSQIASYELNPLYQKSTFYQTPQGTIYASNAPGTTAIPGLTTTTSSLLPLLLVGGVVLLFIAKR